MAPIQSPELDLARCFTGEQQLVTWEIAYRALCDPETASRSDALRAFLTAQDNVETLSRPWKPFADPSTQEKTKFDSKTAPINVTPAPNGHYDIEEIKRDSLWLSKQAQISEYAALQIVVQEWQGRATAQLLSGLTEEEALSVQEAAGITNLGASTFMPNSSILTRPLASRSSELKAEHLRQLRILGIYHSTCASIIRVSQLLVSWGSASQLRSQTIYGNNYMARCAGWIEELGQAIATRQNGPSSNSGAKALDECLKAVVKRGDLLDSGHNFSVDASIWDTVSEYWAVAQTTELLHLLHLAFVHADLVVKGFVPAATIEDWITAFSRRGFFRDFPVVAAQQAPLIPVIQVLTSLLSLSILKLNVIIDDLSSGDYKHWDPSCYILNTGIVESITTMFAHALTLGQSPATPAILAWGILTFAATDRASDEEQERERLLEFNQTSQDPSPTQLALEECALAIRGMNDPDLFNDKPPYETITLATIDLDVFGTVAQFTEIGVPAFGTDIDRVSRDRLRLLFLQLIRVTIGSNIVAYCDELVVSTCTILAGDKTFRNWVDTDASEQSDPVVSYFLEDEDVLRPTLLDYSRLRYPYETQPFLQFCSVLTRGDKTLQNGMPTFVEKLTNANRLMQAMPQGFGGYGLTREEENKDWVVLKEDLPLFMPKSASNIGSQRRLLLSNSAAQSGGHMSIAAGTEGIRLDGGKQPEVAIWYHQHATLPYLCQLLSTYPIASQTVESYSQLPAPREIVGEIVGFFADLLHSSLRSAEGICSHELLENLGISPDSSRDTVSIILAILEEEMLHLAKEPNNEASLELLVKCTRFLEAIIIITPHRVWPWLARSRLLEGDGSGSLATILIGTEMVLGRYDFLIGCIRIYKGLVKDAVERSVSRKTPSKALSRFNAPAPSESGTSDKIISTVLFTFGRTLASIYETSLSWKYSQPDHRPEINIAICEIFTTILKFAYGVDDAPQLSAKLTKSIAPIAEYLTQLYTTASKGDLPTNPILSALVIGVSPDSTTLLTSSGALWTRQTRTTLIFSDILVRIAILLNKPWTHLEQQLFKATPLLARLYATSDAWKSQVVLLLEALVRGAVRVIGPGDSEMADEDAAQTVRKQQEHQEPPSLLGHLGPRTAKNFLSVLSQLDEPLCIVDIQTNVWNLLSAVVTCKQQWFSLYLLTGTTPRESLRTKADASTSTRNRALLTRAFDSISTLKLPEKEAANVAWPLYTAMLEFVSSAQNNWSWAMGDLRERKELIQKLLAFLKWMSKQPKYPRTNSEILERSYQNRFASLACEVISMYLHSSRQVGDITVLKDVVPNLEYLEESALDLPTYNSSLHSYLQKNLERQYPGVSLANLKRTTLYPEVFGRAFFYDPELAQQLLSFDSKWSGPREGTGIASDVEKANFNLGLVESQVLLLQGWKLLSLELSQVVGKDERLVKILNGVITKCMLANTQSNLPEALFGRLMIIRADLAFALLKKLVDAKVSSAETRQLLTPVWNAIHATTADFDNVFSSESVYYYRSLLRILYLTLHFHLVSDDDDSEETNMRSSFRGTVPASHNTHVESISTLLLEILADTVAKGFRSLANQLHAEPSSVSPSDFALLTALLQRILTIPEMSKWQSQAALLFANHNTTRFATSLFSWADKLTITHNGVQDPVYGELSILFLLSLSSIPALAETMAVDGVLSQLNTANITSYFRRTGGMGPFDTPPRMYSIWTKGILPLCLNLVLSVGPAIAAEISSFLNQFPEQLSRASSSINSAHSPVTTNRNTTRTAKITLSTASEIHSLALLYTIIEDVRRQGPKLGIQSSEVNALDWDVEAVKEDLEAWSGRRGILGERVVPVDEREVEMVGRKGVGGGTELEDRVWRELEGASAVLGVGRGGRLFCPNVGLEMGGRVLYATYWLCHG
ncbi:nucleoporin-like protein [Plenodomus tracheiphilus IPT5]|uniref:Nucleoporin-like protein n=1 Tax=Plenodomus tracheiphilus IPT5 TaxID=1408161 RepID=A0A6A7BAT1_9PLEO|nr:nucleoporin-like protein [Plenodomus tracheiphilus IPT5]